MVKVPKSSASSERSAAYVSPATLSMTISVMQGSTSVISQTVGLTASSTGCTSSPTSTTWAQSVAFTVAASQSTLVPLTLSGIPTAIKVYSAGTDSVDVVAQDADGNLIVVQPTASHPNLISSALSVTP